MKKLYIGFILLFGFLTFIPQIIDANSPYPPGYREKTYEKAKKAFNSGCIQKYKSKLSQKYDKQYLEFSPNWKNNLTFIYPEFATRNEYFIYVISNHGQHYYKDKSSVVDCEKELIRIYGKVEFYETKTIITTSLGRANVKEVLPGSFLKFVYDDNNGYNTQTIEVISPTNDEYKDLMEKYKEITKDEDYENNIEKNEKDLLKDKIKSDNSQVKIYRTVENKSETKNNVTYFPLSENTIIAIGILIALILTLVIEGIMALPFGWKFVGLVSLTNLITNPSMNLILWNFSITSTKVILLFEVFVVLIEWGIYSLFIRKNYVKLFLFSLIANTMSYLIGYMINIY